MHDDLYRLIKNPIISYYCCWYIFNCKIMYRCLSGDLHKQYSSVDKNKLRAQGSLTNLSTLKKFQQVLIGKYIFELDNEIGKGFSSKVYLAKSIDNKQQQYAIKVIDLSKFSPLNKELLDNQIHILQSINHPNVIKLYNVYKKDQKCYIVTEYCPYGDLLTYSLKKGKLSEQELIPIMKQVFEGCKYLFNYDIIHRDLKPANILLGNNGWKIADFGFAVQFSGQFRSKSNVGTPLYMPPQSLVKNLYSIKTDIFSLGIIFYQLLTGQTPWQSKTQKQLLRKMLNTPFQTPQKYSISAQTKQLLKKLCAVDSRFRMTSQQFINLNIQNYYSQTKQQQLMLKHKKSLLHTPRNKVSFQSKTSAESTTEINYQKQNNKIIIKQLHFCRFIYYMFKNSHLFPIQPQNKNKLSTILLKHLIKLTKKLSDQKTNHFHLPKWQYFQKSKTYIPTKFTIKEYINRYQKQYQNLVKKMPQQQQSFIDILNSNLNNQIEQSILNKLFIKESIKQYYQNLLKIINKHYNIQPFVAQIEGLNSLYQYYNVIDLNLNDQDYLEKFQPYSNIKVYVDYEKIQGINWKYFEDLSTQIQLI